MYLTGSLYKSNKVKTCPDWSGTRKRIAMTGLVNFVVSLYMRKYLEKSDKSNTRFLTYREKTNKHILTDIVGYL